MMGGSKIKEGNQASSTYIQDMDKHTGANSISIPYANNITITCSNNLVVDLSQHDAKEYILPDLNSIDMTNNVTGLQGFCYPRWNLNELPLDAHRPVVSDSLMSEKVNNLVDMKEITSMLSDKSGRDISVHSAVEINWPNISDGFISLGIDDSTEVKSEYSVNQNGGTNESLNSFHVQKAIGGSTGFNDHVRSVCGSYAYPGSSQLLASQKTTDMLIDYPSLDLKKQFGGSSSEMSDFGNISASPVGLETVKPSLTSTPPNRNQLMRYMRTIKNRVSSATRAKGCSITQENTGKVSPFGSLSAEDANKTIQPPKRKLIQPDGSIYGAKVDQLPNNTGTEMSKDGVLQGNLISNSQNVGVSKASNALCGFSRKRVAKKSPPEAPKVQRKKTTVPPLIIPPVTYVTNIAPTPPVAPKVQRKKNIISNITPNPPAAPRVQRTSKIVPSVASVVPTHSPTSKVQITNITSIPPSVAPTPPTTRMVLRNSKTIPSAPASTVQITNATASSPIISSVRRLPSVVPRPSRASQAQIAPPVPDPASGTLPKNIRPRVTKKTVIPAVAPKVQCNIASTVIPSSSHQPSLGPVALTRPVGLRVQIPANSRTVTPTHLAAPPAVVSSDPFVKVVPPWLRNKRPVIRDSLNIPSVAVEPVPASPERIKWQDPDENPSPLGERCMICKRDLLFTAQGPVFQPVFPPSAAVLPCGHTFHDDCLTSITPIEQAVNPPCIPCAIGEY